MSVPAVPRPQWTMNVYSQSSQDNVYTTVATRLPGVHTLENGSRLR